MGRGTSGGQFERKLSAKLSLWWTDGADDSIFWRSHGSGARATKRSKKSKSTFGQYGDICAVKPIGEPLIDFFCMELKKGYSSFSVADLLDRPLAEKHVQQNHEKWFQQTLEAWKASGSFTWLIFQQRKSRQAIVYMPWNLVQLLKEEGCFASSPKPFATFAINLRLAKRSGTKEIDFKFSILTLTNFLESVSPKVIKKLSRKV